jgi:hypothetical protein
MIANRATANGDPATSGWVAAVRAARWPPVTLSQGIEAAIIQAVPEITSVVDVTDHQSGTNPYVEAAKE